MDTGPGAEDLRALRDAVRGAAARLRAWPVDRRAAGIERAARLLLDAEGTFGAELRRALQASSGLSLPVIERGLRTTLELFERAALCALFERSARGTAPVPDVAVVILAGNVFSAAARPLLLPLLCGVGVVAKTSSQDTALPRSLQRALGAADPELGAACAVVTFERSEAQFAAALTADAPLLSVYGSDDTVSAVSAQCGPETRVIAHGHGLGAIFIASEALPSEAAARALAASAALDIAAYDQRGCLSPHFALVQPGGALDARAFARLLADALAALEPTLPRGPLPRAAASAQLHWRAVAAALGELHAGERWSVSYEADQPPRPSPGYRNVSVSDCADEEAARALLQGLGPHLKALGVAGERARHVLTGTAPYVCELGAMQTPPLDAPLDGLHPLTGLTGD